MKRICAIVAGIVFVAIPMDYVARAELAPDAGAEKQSNTSAQQERLYAEGTKAMDEQRWTDAVTDFDRAATIKGEHSDASLYWKAYSLYKLGRKDQARATCDSLTKQQPQSLWNRECMMLTARLEYARVLADSPRQAVHLDFDQLVPNVDVPPLPARPITSLYMHLNKPTTEDDIKILALNSLMQQEPAKAVPMLRSLLKSDKSVSVREQALFVLSRSKDSQARELLTEIASSKGDPEIQCAAIRMLTLNRGKDADVTLVQIYHESTDAGVKRAAVNGLYLNHDAVPMVELARGEKDLNMKRDIVSQLSLMHDQAATDYMLELLK